MSTDIGIIGLAKSGRTTIFKALTKGQADTGSYRREALTPHVGVAKVPEPRLEGLADILHPKKTVFAEVRYIDIGASVRDLAQDKGIGGESLNRLSGVDALINVVRDFSDESVPHPEGSLDTERDITNMELELTFSDLVLIERRLEKLETLMKAAQLQERQILLREQELLLRIRASLEKGIPLRETALTTDEAKSLANYQFLSAKPLLILVNIGEERLPEAASLEDKLRTRYAGPKRGAAVICGKLEMELAQLEDAAASEFRAEFGVTESGLERTIKLSYDLLGLVSFFTTASEEIKVWPVSASLRT